MIIGERRPEEARALNVQEGYHQFHNEEGVAYGSFEIFWHEGNEPRDVSEYTPYEKPGWYWWPCSPGYTPDSEPRGPFGSSLLARIDADPHYFEFSDQEIARINATSDAS